jgi:hypothetical protein
MNNKVLGRDLTTKAIGDLLLLFSSRALNSAIERVPTPFWTLPMFELEKAAHPTELERLLRISLWEQIKNAITTGRKIRPVDIYGKFCTAPYFYQGILRRPDKVAFLFHSPFPAMKEQLRMVVPFAIERLKEILSHPVKDRWGKINQERIDRALQAIQMLRDLVL